MSDILSHSPQEISGAVYVGDIPSEVAGTYFHTASAHPGESVSLVREPWNFHDVNAIAVHNDRWERVGYVPREQAAVLAPYIDNFDISLTGRLHQPGEPEFDVNLARTRPRMVIHVFLNAQPGSVVQAGATVPPRVTRPNSEGMADRSHEPDEFEMAF